MLGCCSRATASASARKRPASAAGVGAGQDHLEGDDAVERDLPGLVDDAHAARSSDGGRKNRCRFCTKEGCPRPAFVDYKDVQGLKKLCTSQGKLFSRKRSGNCAAFQRAVKDAIRLVRGPANGGAAPAG